MKRYQRLRRALRECYGTYRYKIDRQGRVFVLGRNAPEEAPAWHLLGPVWTLESMLCGGILPLPYVVMPLSLVEGAEKWPYQIGSRLHHTTYGEGAVVGYLQSRAALCVRVRFPIGEIGFSYDRAKNELR